MTADLDSVLESLGAARRFADPSAPRAARLMAARGALPVSPEQIASILFALSLDSDEEIRTRATQSLEELPAAVLEPALEASLHPALLDHLARRTDALEVRLEKIALNPATSDETFCFLARRPFARLIDIVANNQMRLLRCPELVEALGENPAASQATIDRVLEFLGISQDKPDEDRAASPEDTEDLSGLPPTLLEEHDGSSEEGGVDEKTTGTMLALIQNMKVVEKIKLARFGNKEARALLMRDRNRIVSLAAVRSPKISESEVISVAQSRNVSDDVLRVVAASREWTKGYSIKLALATNPKAPLAAAIKFLNYLTDRDLKTIMRSRDVPGPVSQQARRILARKGK